MDHFALPKPVSVPKDLSKPSGLYKRHVWLAMAALLAFVGLYLALTGWFAWSAFRLARGAFSGGKDSVLGIFVAPPLAFLTLFMLKALFFREKRDHSRDFEITPAAEPRLFAFLYEIADAARAPRPHRVFLSPQVNAGVFYDLSILNLLIPSRKNLDIGLGLINALSLGELRAVLAHEFGHFGQRAMAVGRWVYVAQRVASHIVNKRDALDRLLLALSGIDLRIAWIGWSMRIVVWSLRSVLDTAFALVVLAERALSREMEMQADLVAVSLTGSDALVHALHKLAAADAAWDQSLGITAGQFANGKAVPDVFELHTRVLERARGVLADATYGVAPPLPAEGRAQHRVFEQRMAHPPRMWSTHPPNHEREENAKRTYVACELDERSSWLLFSDAPALRRQMTEFFQRLLDKPKDGVKSITREEALAVVDRQFDHPYLDPRYQGAYLRRSVVRSSRALGDLYLPLERRAALDPAEMYPNELRQALERSKVLEEEREMLQGLERGLLQAGGGNISFRGRVLRRRDLRPTLDRVTQECAAARVALDEFDRKHRSVHLALAERLGRGWPEYLRGLAALLHYADHSEANIRDARAHLANVFAVVTADGSVSKGERKRLAVAGVDVCFALQQAFEQRKQVQLPDEIKSALEIEEWSEALPEHFNLSMPHAENIGQWLEVVDSWLDGFIAPFDALERRALVALLENEAKVLALSRDPANTEVAPRPAAVPPDYARLLPGAERERQWRLDLWDRFQIAQGFWPSLARFAVAGTCVGATVVASAAVGKSSVIIYNGLGLPVVVHVGEATRQLLPLQTARINGLYEDRVEVRAESLSGELIERFDATMSESFAQYVYNVASAAPLVEWTAVYGNARELPNNNMGSPRWYSTRAEVLFEDPPHDVSTKSGGATRLVLSGAGEATPMSALALVNDEASRTALVHTHALWDDSSASNTAVWLDMAGKLPDFGQIVARRLKREPGDVVALRAEQDGASDATKREVCERDEALARASAGNADLQYLAIRCRPPGPERDQAFLKAAANAPSNGWLAYSVGHLRARKGEWSEALVAYRSARALPALAQHVEIEMARLLRVLGPKGDAELSQLAESSPAVKVRLSLEFELGPVPEMLKPYPLLMKGNLAGAVEAASANPQQRARVLRLIAASKGASAEQLEAALALKDDEGIDRDTIWPAIGLWRKRGFGADALVARLGEFAGEGEAETAREFAEPEKLLKDPARATELEMQLAPWTRAHAYVMAAVILGDRTPENWLTSSRALLFADERPRL